MGGDVITQQLHRNHREQGAEQLLELRQGQQQIKQLRIPAGWGHPNQLGIAGLGLLGIGEHLVEHGAWHRDRHHRHPGIQERNGTMLHLPGRVALGMDVADLLELEGPLHGNRIINAPPKENHILSVGKQVGQLRTALVVVVDHPAHHLRQAAQLKGQGRQPLRARHPGPSLAPLGKRQGQAIKSQQLAQEGFRGRHPHLDARADIQQVGHQPAQGTLGPVGDAQQARLVGRICQPLAPLLLHHQGGQGVGRLPRLGHPDGEGVGPQGRRRITKLAGVKHVRGDPRQLLQQIGAHLGRMAAGATGQDLDLLHPCIYSLIQGQGHQSALRQMAGHPKGRRFGLLMDFLEHEMAEAALVRHVLRAREQAGGSLHPAALAVVKLNAQRCEQGRFSILEGQDRAGESRQGGGIASAEELPLPQADQQGSLPAGHHQGAGRLGPHHRQGIGPVEQREHLLHRPQQQRCRRLQALGLQLGQTPRYQVGNHLGVGVGKKPHPLGLQLLPQQAVVLNDAVLDHRQLAAPIEMGMGVALLRLSMGGPAGVADAALSRSSLGLETGREIHQLAFGLQAMKAIPIHRGDSRRVVAPILKLSKAFQQLGRRFPRPNQGNDAAHTVPTTRLSLWGNGAQHQGERISRTGPSSGWSRRPGRRGC